MPSFGASRDYRPICTSQSLEPIAKDTIYVFANIFQVLSLISVNHVLTFKKKKPFSFIGGDEAALIRQRRKVTHRRVRQWYGTRISHQTASAEVEDIYAQQRTLSADQRRKNIREARTRV